MKYARLFFRFHDPEGINQYDPIGSGGARMLLRHIDDDAKRTAIYEKHMENREPGSTVTQSMLLLVEVIETYPVG